MAGSYDTMLQFFGLYGLTNASSDFYGLPSYASTMVFELFTEKNTTAFPTNETDLRVRFLFRNSSDTTSELKVFPLLALEASNSNKSTSLPWEEFDFHMRQSAITTVDEWCSICSSSKTFCAATYGNPAPVPYHDNKISNPVAGVIGAMVALAVVGGIGAGAFLFFRRRLARMQAVTMEAAMWDKVEMGGLKSAQ
jgi:hypothetical protein